MKLIKQKAIFQIIVIIFSIFTVSLLNPKFVKAQQNVCCEKTNSGESCVYTDAANCDRNFNTASTTCEQTQFCQVGCCVADDGYCHKNTPLATCRNNNGQWNQDSNCGIAQCQKGCCVIGDSASFVTSKRCDELIKNYPNLQKDFRSVASELECINLARGKEKGCCVGQDGSCTYAARDSCDPYASVANVSKPIVEIKESDIGFHSNTYCSDSKLPCKCTAKHHKGCVDEDVYWFDSCGNQEGIAEDCSYEKETLCGLVNNEYKCKSVNCAKTFDKKTPDGQDIVEYDNVARKNGESWCQYDGAVGFGLDLVGSRHYRHMCVNGEEVVEPCKDYREEFCIQATINAKEKTYTEAACKENRWESCTTTCNKAKPTDPPEKYKADMKKDKECCEKSDLRDCFWTGTTKKEADKFKQESSPGFNEKVYKTTTGEWISDEEINNTQTTESKDAVKIKGGGTGEEGDGKCMPIVPPGFKFWPEKSEQETPKADSGNQYCDKGDQSCKVVFVKKGVLGKWKCKVNCHCLTKEYGQAVNAYCRSLGDCGAHFNIAGKFTKDGLQCSDSKNMDCKGNVRRSKIETMDFDPGDWITQWSKAGQGLNVFVDEKDLLEGLEALMGTKEGQVAIGSLLAAYAFKKYIIPKLVASLAIKTSLIEAAITKTLLSQGISQAMAAKTANLLASKLAGTEITAASVKAAAAELGASGEIIAVGEANAAGIAQTAQAAQTGAGAATAATVVMVIIVLIILLFLWKKTDEMTIDIDCETWQAPPGGKDCEKCTDKDMLKKLNYNLCTEYRCKSLGQACEIVNPGTEFVACVDSNPNDVNAPIISPWKEALTKGYSISEFAYGYSINPKIEPFIPIKFGIKTDEYAQCKIADNHTLTYDQMPAQYFGDALYKKEHNLTINLEPNKEYSYYVRCQDIHGNKNTREYTIKMATKAGPDLTAPVIELTSIADDSYLAYGVNETALSIYLNEPSSCKWAKNDTSYEFMQNEFLCSSGLTPKYQLYECSTILTNLTFGANKFYFRCKDKANNENSESYEFTLIGTVPLEITSTEPSREIFYNNPILKVTTYLGAESGKSTCRFSEQTSVFENMITFFKTNSTMHEQQLQNLITGNYMYYITCRDIAGNEAYSNITFKISVDTYPPLIERIFTDSVSLHLILNEDSTCEYSNSTFSYGQGIQMTGINIKEHTAALQSIYYTICRDIYNNEMPLTIIKP